MSDQGWRKATIVLVGMVLVTILAIFKMVGGDTAVMTVCGLAAGYTGINMLTRKVR